MTKFIKLGAALALSLAVIAPAEAAIIIVTAGGTLSGGRDDLNTLGLGTDLTGQTVSLVFTFDDATPGAYLDPNSLSGYGPDWTGSGDFSPGSAVVTIGGIDLATLGDYYSNYDVSAQYGAGGAWDTVIASAVDNKFIRDDLGEVIASDWRSVSISAAGLNILTSGNLHQNVDLPLGSANGSFEFYSWNYDPDIWGYNYFISGQLDPQSLNVSIRSLADPNAVPEPSTWAMMLFGFGAVGAAMRRRPRQIFTAA